MRKYIYLILLLALTFIVACGSGQGSGTSATVAGKERLKVSMTFEGAERRAQYDLEFTELWMYVIPENTAYAVQEIDILTYFNNDQSVNITGLVDGENYVFVIKGYDANYDLIYVGSNQLTVQAGNNALSLYVNKNEISDTVNEYGDAHPESSLNVVYDAYNAETKIITDIYRNFNRVNKHVIYNASSAGPYTIGYPASLLGTVADLVNGFEFPITVANDIGINYSAGLSVGDTFQMRTFFTNVFGQPDAWYSDETVGNIFTVAPTILNTDGETAEISESYVLQWSLPQNTPPDDYINIRIKYTPTDGSSSSVYTFLGNTTATSYTFPAGTFSADKQYQIIVDLIGAEYDKARATTYINTVDTTGSQATFSNIDLNGIFKGQTIAYDTNGEYASYSSISFDGVGNYGVTNIVDSETPSNSSGSYTVASDGLLSAGFDIGQLSPNADIFSFVKATTIDDVELIVGVKESTGMSNADLSGIYIVHSFGVDPDHYSTRILLDCDGVGNCTDVVLSDSNGLTGSGSGTYSINAIGEITYNHSSGTLAGQLSSDGSFFILNDIVAGGGPNYGFVVGVKQGSGYTNASLNGSYTHFSLDYMGGVIDEHSAVASNIIFDGAGNLSAVELADTDGIIDSGSFTYAVSADGTLSTSVYQSVGQVSPDGSVYVVLDSDNSDTELGISIGIRQP